MTILLRNFDYLSVSIPFKGLFMYYVTREGSVYIRYDCMKKPYEFRYEGGGALKSKFLCYVIFEQPLIFFVLL